MIPDEPQSEQVKNYLQNTPTEEQLFQAVRCLIQHNEEMIKHVDLMSESLRDLGQKYNQHLKKYHSNDSISPEGELK